ncbi:MAG: hypothetical protein M0R17_02785 [Candidatus Omnitrophica bacterium]|jgi:DnaJ-class molecular chaperone|nr:hypothetical protein [Candidatus Omnitrophota bacterium]
MKTTISREYQLNYTIQSEKVIENESYSKIEICSVCYGEGSIIQLKDNKPSKCKYCKGSGKVRVTQIHVVEEI